MFEPDKEILQRAAQGDAEAFRRLAEGLQEDLFNMAWRMTYNREDAMDLSQEILVKLHRNLHRYDSSRPFLPWFRKLFRNAGLNYRRAMRPTRMLPEDSAGETPPGEIDDADQISAALTSLPEEYRMVVSFKYYEDMDVREISDVMGTPVATIKTWLFRARDALRQKLDASFGKKR